MKKTVIIVGLLLVAGAAGFYFYNKKKKTTVTQPEVKPKEVLDVQPLIDRANELQKLIDYWADKTPTNAGEGQQKVRSLDDFKALMPSIDSRLSAHGYKAQKINGVWQSVKK